MRIPEDLAFRLFGYSAGSWFWVPNEQSGWSGQPGSHPFVLTAAYDGGPTATTRARSTTSRDGIAHRAHPLGHVTNCGIKKPGWIQHLRWTVGPDAICAENYSCGEPYDEILAWLAAAP